ncbi:purine-nucleoside phosphorylase [Oceanibacterium hippocampi]|uniref:Purine nucleoside phosphorylase n=1 Tax=Oceanibacterium hippocampi TaxID=745714 RepID=A0A1Y5TW17_9PROT|nr:purine-nucleoside phosphorylase [Oceanibacterium hippocampi]SLN74704.1 Purine nucleoside phosphorylase 2 [Oceanibacterium hippocampi]
MAAHDEAAALVSARAGAFRPRLGLVLGSGLNAIAEAIETVARIPYAELAGFPPSRVAGHAGMLVLGRLGGVDVACLQGRAHLYEGHDPSVLRVPVRLLRAIGCEALLLTNAAGSLRPEAGPGSLMMITDHINMTGANPLVGINDDDVGPRFPDMVDAYDPALCSMLDHAAAASGVTLHRGVYMAMLGPTFETPAEIRAAAVLGADAVGMSTVPEAIVARHCGLRVAAVSLITNLAAGMSQDHLSHEQTLAAAGAAAGRMEALIIAFLRRFAESARA